MINAKRSIEACAAFYGDDSKDMKNYLLDSLKAVPFSPILMVFGIVGCGAMESYMLKQAFIDARNKNYIESFKTELSFQDALDCMVNTMMTYTALPNPDLSIVRSSPNPNSKIIGSLYEIDGSNKQEIFIHSLVSRSSIDIKKCIYKQKLL